MRWLLLFAVGCSASSPTGSGQTGSVVQKEIPLSDGTGDVGVGCFEVELVDPPDCVASLFRDGVEERVLGSCEQDPTGLCWRIEVDVVACPETEAHQLVEFDNVTAADLPSVVKIQCVSVDML